MNDWAPWDAGPGVSLEADFKAAIDRPGSLSRLVNGDREGAIAIGPAKLDVAEHEFRFALRLLSGVRRSATTRVPGSTPTSKSSSPRRAIKRLSSKLWGSGWIFFPGRSGFGCPGFRRSGILTFSTWRGLVGAGFL